MTMKVLVDENLPNPTASVLGNFGHDVASVSEISPGASDAEVFEYAVTEQMMLVTLDKGDFGALIYGRRLPAPPAVLMFRLPDLPADGIPHYVAGTIAARSDWAGFFWVIGQKKVRSRPFPAP